MEQNPLFQRYRSDRRKLLEFLLSSGSIKEIRNSAGPVTSLAEIDLDCLSVDYVLHCVKSSGVVDISETTKQNYTDSAYPIAIYSQSQNTYFLQSDPDSNGSPPRRVPPPTNARWTVHHGLDSSTEPELSNVSSFKDDFNRDKEAATTETLTMNSKILALGLPSLKTGLSDDDLRESAYELMLTSMLFSGVEIYSDDGKRKEKNSKFLSGLRRKEKLPLQSSSSDRHLTLINTLRAQMQISEALDACTRRSLVQLTARRTYGQVDLPQLALGLLIGIFKSDFPNEKYYMQWKTRQANMLEELLYFSANLEATERVKIRSYFAKIRDAKAWDIIMSPSQRIEVLSSIRHVALRLSSLPGRMGLRNETYYWTAAYHLNIRLYEKLLFALFDILDESQLIEEADKVLPHIISAQNMLGITEKMHHAIYGWVLFQQFVKTGEGLLLNNALVELQKVMSAQNDDGKVDLYITSLVCIRQINGREVKLSLVQAIFLSISIYCDDKLQDYHLHFKQEPSNFRRVVSLALTFDITVSADCAEIKFSNLNASDDDAVRRITMYTERSLKAACSRAAKSNQQVSEVKRIHYLALLADELRLVAEREFSVFGLVLRHWLPECMMISAMLLHQFYGERLKPYLRTVSSLSDDVRSVLPAACMLDHYLTMLYNNASEERKLLNHFSKNLEHYQIVEVSKPIILDWVIAQHARILEWTGRAFDQEDWEPVSFHQRQAASIIEVFRIVEEAVGQLFGFNLPMDITHLQALLSVIYHTLDSYLHRLLDQLVEKKHLYPSTPPLTRVAESLIPVMKKKLVHGTNSDENIVKKLKKLTISKLCIRLNTLQYIQKQLSTLENGIRKSWALVRRPLNQASEQEVCESSKRGLLTQNESVDELFATTFNSLKDTTKNLIIQICDLTGARVVFWDLRDTFLLQMYRGTVDSARLESFIPHFDTVLDNICGLIGADIRDLLVLTICRAAMEAYVWVLLDGGPSRAFSDSDVALMEEDFEALKEFFIAGGEGLPRRLVEQEAKLAEQILTLFSLEAETVIQMLMTASELISMGLDPSKHGDLCVEDAHTLVRVLCHKKDKGASKFLKKQYNLPMSSEYDDTPSKDSTSKSSPLMSELLKQSSSFNWSKKSHGSFRLIKKRLQEATADIRNATWT